MRIDNPISSNAQITGSFTGSFKGDGTLLTGVTAEWDGSHNGNGSITGSLNVSSNIVVGGTVDGRDLATDGIKLDGIEASATADQSAAEILSAILTVDGAGSGLDADLLDGQSAAYYSTATAVDLKADIASPTFTGVVTITTADSNDNSTKAASTAFVQTEISDLIGGAGAAFDTLLEISASIANGDSDVVALTTIVGGKLQIDQNLWDLTDAVSARTNLGVAIGTDVQAFDAQLTDVAGLEPGDGNFIVGDGTNFVAESGDTARTSLGLHTSDYVQFDSFGVGTAASGTTGEIRATGDITAYYSSDERLKENFAPLTGALDKIKAIGGYEFDWKKGIEDVVSKTGHDIGVKAQELQAQYPDLVHERDNGYLAVDYIKLTAVLIEAVKELSAKVDQLTK